MTNREQPPIPDTNASLRAPAIQALNLDRSVRVGVVEIGSRSLRSLIADVSDKKGLEPLFTRAVDIEFMTSVRKGLTNITLSHIQSALADFRKKAAELKATRIVIFGTQAMRHVAALPEFQQSPLLAGIEILDQRSEAFCSLIASIKGMPRLKSKRGAVLAIDQGGGSIELALGSVGPPIEMSDFVSLELGGDRLLQYFASCQQNLEELSNWLSGHINSATVPQGKAERVVVQGSVATKCAWLAIRRDKAERYEPKRVHGTILDVQALQHMLSYVGGMPPEKWGPVRAFVDPSNPRSDAFERVITGATALKLLLQRLGSNEFVVSAHGTRHGMAWRLADETQDGT